MSRNKKRKFTITIGFVEIPTYISVIMVVVISAIVYLTIQTVTSGAKLSYIEVEEARLEKENGLLNDQLIMQSSLSEISKSAEELGFQKPTKVVYASTDEVVAKLP